MAKIKATIEANHKVHEEERRLGEERRLENKFNTLDATLRTIERQVVETSEAVIALQASITFLLKPVVMPIPQLLRQIQLPLKLIQTLFSSTALHCRKFLIGLILMEMAHRIFMMNVLLIIQQMYLMKMESVHQPLQENALKPLMVMFPD